MMLHNKIENANDKVKSSDNYPRSEFLYVSQDMKQ